MVTAICLSAGFATAVLWVRSPRHLDVASWTTADRNFSLQTFPHGVSVTTYPDHDNSGPVLVSVAYFVPSAPGTTPVPEQADWSRLGFALHPVWDSDLHRDARRAFSLSIPFWSILLVAGIPPCIAVMAWVRIRYRVVGVSGAGTTSGAAPAVVRNVARGRYQSRTSSA